MAGTSEGGQKAGHTNKERHGKQFYRGIGRLGGLKSRGGGFASDPELASLAGRRGGLKQKDLWTPERRARMSVQMKDYWRKRREPKMYEEIAE